MTFIVAKMWNTLVDLIHSSLFCIFKFMAILFKS